MHPVGSVTAVDSFYVEGAYKKFKRKSKKRNLCWFFLVFLGILQTRFCATDRGKKLKWWSSIYPLSLLSPVSFTNTRSCQAWLFHMGGNLHLNFESTVPPQKCLSCPPSLPDIHYYCLFFFIPFVFMHKLTCKKLTVKNRSVLLTFYYLCLVIHHGQDLGIMIVAP